MSSESFFGVCRFRNLPENIMRSEGVSKTGKPYKLDMIIVDVLDFTKAIPEVYDEHKMIVHPTYQIKIPANGRQFQSGNYIFRVSHSRDDSLGPFDFQRFPKIEIFPISDEHMKKIVDGLSILPVLFGSIASFPSGVRVVPSPAASSPSAASAVSTKV
jgi:hypothetical protein